MIRRFSFVLVAGLLLTSGIGGTEIVELIYHPCGDTPVFCFGAPRECDGLINNRGEILHRFKVSHEIEGPFNEGLLAAEFPGSGRWGYLDTRGQWAIKPKFGFAWPFRGGLARVEEEGTRREGFIDKSGEYAIAPKFDEATDFDTDGFARFWVGEWRGADRRMGVMDRDGNVVVEPRGQFYVGEYDGGVAKAILAGSACWMMQPPFRDAYLFGVSNESHVSLSNDQRERVMSSDCKWTLIDITGKPVSETQFDEIGAFSEGLAPARIGNLWGYIDRTGEFKLSPKWVYAGVFSNGLASVGLQDPNVPLGPFGGWTAAWQGFIDTSGEVAFETEVGSGGFSEGIAFVGGYAVDSDGNRLFKSPRDDRAGHPFCHGLSQVLLDDDGDQMETAFINRKGRVVFAWKWRW